MQLLTRPQSPTSPAGGISLTLRVVAAAALLGSCTSDGSPPAPDKGSAAPGAADAKIAKTAPAEPPKAQPAVGDDAAAKPAEPAPGANGSAANDPAAAPGNDAAKPAGADPAPSAKPVAGEPATRHTADKQPKTHPPGTGTAPKSEKNTGRGKPECRHVGTRSEQWSWPDGERIDWAKCDKITAECKHVGSKSEGWYSGDKVIVYVNCGKKQ